MTIAALILAAAVCLPTDQAHRQLDEQHGKSRIIAGLSDRGTVLEVWSAEDGSWTALVTGADGVSCVVDTGQEVTVFPAGEGA